MSFVLLGILNSQAAGAVGGGTYDLLETTVLGSDTSSVSFTSLNSTYGSTYKHLQIRMVARDSVVNDASLATLQFNSDTGTNYARHFLRGFNGNVQSGSGTSQTLMWVARIAAASSASDSFGGGVVDILDPFDTAKNTTVRSLSGVTSVDNSVELQSGLYIDTSAIDEIKLAALSGNLVTGSRFSLYGIRAA